MTPSKVTAEHRLRRAFISVRQSTPTQLVENHESRRRQCRFEELARELGFSDVKVINDDFGMIGSSWKSVRAFNASLRRCIGRVGTGFCVEASRLVRNNCDWHQLRDLYALTGPLLIDPCGEYYLRGDNYQLLPGLQGAMGEDGFTLLRERSVEVIRMFAERGVIHTGLRIGFYSLAEDGELGFGLPIGICWAHDGRLEREPDTFVQQGFVLVFERLRELGSTRPILLWIRSEAITLPAIQFGTFGREIMLIVSVHQAILKLLEKPALVGAYVPSKTERRNQIFVGRAKRTHEHRKPRGRWPVMNCGLPDAMQCLVSSWTFDTSVCSGMRLGESRAAVDALLELQVLVRVVLATRKCQPKPAENSDVPTSAITSECPTAASIDGAGESESRRRLLAPTGYRSGGSADRCGSSRYKGGRP